MLTSPFLFFFPIIFEALGDLGVNQKKGTPGLILVWFPKKFSGSSFGNHTQFQFQVTWSEIWLIIPIPDFFPQKKENSKNFGSGSGFGYWRGALNCAHWMW
jgi:hypothetical protein